MIRIHLGVYFATFTIAVFCFGGTGIAVTQASSTDLQYMVESMPPLAPSQAIGDQMMREYSPQKKIFTSVYIDSPDEVRVLLTSAEQHQENIDGVKVNFVRSLFTLDEYWTFSQALLAVNPQLHSVEIQADEMSLIAKVTIGTPKELKEIVRPESLPRDVSVRVIESEVEVLEAAQGAKLVTGNGCTSGFRMNFNRISTASHCSSNWGTVNGTLVTNTSNKCSIDNRWGSASSISLLISGYGWWGGQYDPANGQVVEKYGTSTGWSYGYAGNYSTISASCVISVQIYTGGNLLHNGGDSGGPYLTLAGDNPQKYIPRGTHRGYQGNDVLAVPISAINAAGWYVQ